MSSTRLCLLASKQCARGEDSRAAEAEDTNCRGGRAVVSRFILCYTHCYRLSSRLSPTIPNTPYPYITEPVMRGAPAFPSLHSPVFRLGSSAFSRFLIGILDFGARVLRSQSNGHGSNKPARQRHTAKISTAMPAQTIRGGTRQSRPNGCAPCVRRHGSQRRFLPCHR